MKRSLIVMLVALLGLLLAACVPAGAQAPAPTQPPATNVPATNAPQAKATEPAKVASTPAAAPDMQKIIKAQPDDWKRGPDNAKVTIIEWGDFQ
jgi:hypothetical protein